MPAYTTRRLVPLVGLLCLLASCGGKEGDSDDSREHEEREEKVEVSTDPAKITPAMIALGDSLFHGKIGASSCQACHGVGGNNGTAAPSLTDAEWLHSDGSLDGIYRTIKTGVMAPKKFSSVMPPYGGFVLTDEKTIAVASYVYSISHK